MSDVIHMINEGELDDPYTLQELLEQAGRKLDKACSHDIIGSPVMFIDDKDDVYVVNVEAIVCLAHRDFAIEQITELLAENVDEEDIDKELRARLETWLKEHGGGEAL